MMHWNRSALILLSCVGICTLHIGCAVFDSMVRSPAGHAAPRGEAKRLAAIGRVFENQGHYRKAQAMYREALKAQPDNAVAQERLQHIASMQAEREFRASEQNSVAAVADSLTPRARAEGAEKPNSVRQPSESRVIQVTNVGETMQHERNVVVASLQPVSDSKFKQDRAETRQAATTMFQVPSNIDWFDVNAQIDLEGRLAAVPESPQAVGRGDAKVGMVGGSRGILPEQFREQIGMISGPGALEDDRLRFSNSQAVLLDSLLSAHDAVGFDDRLQGLHERFRNFSGTSKMEPMHGFTGEMRGFQRIGLSWVPFPNDWQAPVPPVPF